MQQVALPSLFAAPSADVPHQTVPLPQSQHQMHVAVFTGVKNAKEVRSLLIKGDESVPQMALINAAPIVDVFQVQLACTKALLQQEQGIMKTRSLYSEILFNLCPTTNISDAIRQFGIAESSSTVIAVMLGTEAPSVEKQLIDLVQGDIIEVNRIPDFTDLKTVSKIYKLGNAVRDHSETLALVIGAMALKGHLN
ncbi:kinase binding protein CGI-121-domain-containing protein [Powellomyces hirtus]|nr:kinase binding protein CGI-121-domain-containing protein [Powellomyces hirtus]